MHSSRTITVTMPATMRKPLGPDLPDWLQEALVEALQRRSIRGGVSGCD